MPQGGFDPGTSRSQVHCLIHSSILPLHRIWQKNIAVHYSCVNKEISVFSAVCQLISKKIYFIILLLKELHFVFTYCFWCINFFVFFPRNSATSQQNEIVFIVLKPFLSDRYMVPMLSLVYLFYFLMISWLLGKKRVDFMYLWRLSADFKKFWWSFTSLGKPKFDI